MSASKLSIIGITLLLWYCCSLLLFTKANSQTTHPDEVKALRAIKNSLVDPNGNLSNWRRGDPCISNWTGVLCYNQTNNDGYFHVRELQLLDMDLSGNLSPELGRLSYMRILDVMWNAISGTIPKEIGNIKTLELLLLNGNELTGSLPEELGYLPNLNRIQIDQNHISGPLPVSFAKLEKAAHFHMNNNSISGQIPPELSKLPKLLHLLLDNNNLSGYLPPELAQIPNLRILSLRNCSLQGPVPNLGNIPNLTYIDLSLNELIGSIPSNMLSDNMTTIDLSYNNLNGTIPSNFSSLPHLQKLSLENNSLSGSVPSIIWQNRTLNATETLILDLRNNKLLNISGPLAIPQNVTVSLQGNPLCSNSILFNFCGPYNGDAGGTLQLANNTDCPPLACPPPYEYALPYPTCFCALPLLIGYRLKSPGFRDFRSYMDQFKWYITIGLKLNISQLHLNTFSLEAGPRVKMYLRIFPIFDDNNSSRLFNKSEVLRLRSMFTGWLIPDNDLFGPYELINFTLLADYREFIPPPSSSGISKGALAGIILGVIAGAVTISAFVSLLILRLHMKKHHHASSKRSLLSKISVKIDGVKEFNFEELTLATKNFDNSSIVGQGGYGKVYQGTLADGTAVAIKRAQEGSLQGQKEFLTEIELLSRLHHRNLVSLLGYCGEEGEQMLVYEFMPNGTLRDHLSGKCKEPLSFAMRLKVALGSAKGILYLHTEADPPIFHRDIKASNILLDSKFIAKVADFGLSRLAPVPDLEGTLPAHVSTVVKGTPGYLDPEYFLTHKLTDKSDVYSLGVVFLELLTGMQPISHGKNIVREVNLAYRSGMIFNVIDDQMGSYPSECVEKFINLALKCCQEETEGRPSMVEVVRELENIRVMMPESYSIIRDSVVTDSEKDSRTPSSTSAMKYPFVSADVSGSDLVSGVVPSINPR
ncbi:probable LRR receptor-like serine/threonine-protein kinase At1g06840 isoform X2 [Solanum lycopersicum]|uniref:probable LRR receptor-like serine/threonine-protein kinase At1g06840 isoform X2 n=2 Tax=Solanum lycopersicum TaxID=4081 RepID=UPI000532D71A|nr:probable LRR receptor-like serine/threonine-protein kinase At1g06840 isoform X2 [Solanum lycopersicum]